MQLNLTNIHYTYPESPNEVLHGVTLTLPQGWTGVVGDNGCGKSTLARVAIGEHAPTSGQVFPHLLGAYCEQDCAVAPPELSDFACDYSREAIHLRDLLGIRDDCPGTTGSSRAGSRSACKWRSRSGKGQTCW